MKLLPTDKQINFIHIIENTLNKKFKGRTKDEAREWISSNIEAYYDAIRTGIELKPKKVKILKKRRPTEEYLKIRSDRLFEVAFMRNAMQKVYCSNFSVIRFNELSSKNEVISLNKVRSQLLECVDILSSIESEIRVELYDAGFKHYARKTLNKLIRAD